MKKVLFVVVVVVWGLSVLMTTTGCSDKKPSMNDSTALGVDSASLAKSDTLSQLIEGTAMPKGADELFDDFIFNFAANSKLQRQRVQFPLPVKAKGKLTNLDKSKWKTEHFFMRQGYYTLIFDNEKQMEIVNDTSVNHVIVEKVHLYNKSVQQYIFKRINGRWMLTMIDNNAMYQNQNASFLAFYERFASDDEFQKSSLHVPVTVVVPDPDDDFKMMTADLYPEQWMDFRPQILPKNFIYNIIYGQKYTNSNQKLFVIRGIANGLETQMTFRNMKGKWKLVKMIT
ncbi:MAG: DUF4348 domain-containing protein [Prevotella sp.]|nr:DUF4348 domain-containing protein [Prevotella sp.]